MIKKLIILLSFITMYYPYLFSQLIGINTLNPESLVHIDGASSPETTNPINGTASILQLSDDIIITNYGQIGVGTSDIKTKLNLIHDHSGAIRIIDGTEGEYLSLRCNDTDGNASWGFVGIPWYALLKGASLPETTANSQRTLENYTETLISGERGSLNAVSGEITTPAAGRYLVTINGYYYNTRSGLGTTVYAVCPNLYVNGVCVYTFQAYSVNRWSSGVYVTFVQEFELNEDDVLKVVVDETQNLYTNKTNEASLFVEYIGK